MQLPSLGPAAVTTYRKFKLLQRNFQARRIASKNVKLPDPETIYWIDPCRIKSHTNFNNNKKDRAEEDRVFHPIRDKGKVYGGNWDISQLDFRDLEIYRALENVILHGENWENTEFYRALLKGLNGKNIKWSIDDREKLDARCRYIDKLIHSIQSNGYKQAYETCLPGDEDNIKKHEKFGSEISVNIGRNGHYLFQDGRHRLAIAQILKLDIVPVKVHVRHRKWIEFRSFLRTLATDGGGASEHQKLYQQPVHPDLNDIPVMHECIDRYEVIRENLDNSRGFMLEIGANLAYFCHRFEDLGFKCVAVEYLPQISSAAQRIRDAEEKHFEIISMDLFSATEQHRLNQVEFDVILALNIFHHFLKYPETYRKLTSWLGEIQVSQLFFETHCASEEQMKNAYLNYDEAEFNKFIIANSELSYSKLIYRCEDGRALYKLWR